MIWTTRPRSDFGSLRAIRSGAGPTVVLLHGVGLRAEAWNGQIDALSQRFSIVAPDTPGHGESPRIDGRPDLGAYVDAVAEAADAIDEPVLLAGHSMGAMIALDFAIRRPAKTMGVAALNAIYRRPPEASAAVRRRADALEGRRAADPEPTLRRWFGESSSPERNACRDWLGGVDPAGYRAAYAVFAREDGPRDEDLAALNAPALFLTGDREPNSTPSMSETMAALTPRGEAIILAGAAHMAPMTHANAVTAALLAFFTECRR